MADETSLQSERQRQGASSSRSGPSSSLTEWAQQYSVEATPLGRGSFASVYKGVHRATRKPVAIKVMTKTRLGERALNMLAAEINILRTLEHPNVVCLRDSHSTERRILIVLEYCGGGDLGQFIQSRGPSPESTARHFMVQLAAGLSFLRSRRLIHRDIKPQNLLLSERSPTALLKIADFGLARHLPQGSLAESMLGSPLYMAPEVLSNRAYDAKADLWSAGAVLYELLTARHPFGGANQTELINNIRRNRPRLPAGVSLSPACLELLGMLLVPRPAERASLEAFLSCSFLKSSTVPSPAAAAAAVPGKSDGAGAVSDDKRRSNPGMAIAPAVSSRTVRGAPSDAGPSFCDDGQEVSCGDRAKSDVETSPLSEAPARTGTARAAAAAAAAAVVGRGGVTAADVARDAHRSITPEMDDHRQGPEGEEDGRQGSSGGVRQDFNWGWNWGAQGVVPEGFMARLGDQGPLPALPALPFALGSVGDDGNEGGREVRDGDGDGAAHMPPEVVAFDLAFAAAAPRPNRSSAPSDAGFARSRRSLSTNDAVAEPRSTQEGRRGGGDQDTALACGLAADADTSRRKRFHTDATHLVVADSGATGAAVGPSARAAADAAAADAAEIVPPTSAAVDAATDERSPASPLRRRSRSFSGQDAAPSSVRFQRANTFSESPGARRTTGARRGPGPEPVFYLGKEGSVPGPVPSPAHSRRSSRQGTTYSLTPPSPAYHPRQNAAVAAGAEELVNVEGRASRRSSLLRGASPEGASHACASQPRARAPPAVATAAAEGEYPFGPCPSASFLDDGGVVGGDVRDNQGHYQHTLGMPAGKTPTAAGAPLTPATGGASASASANVSSTANATTASPDGGLPLLVKYPSLRAAGGGGGGDSLLTIPEDSTGFVLVTRPSSISCEHGPTCECWAWSAGGGGGGGAICSPSASYLAAANPYGGPSKTSAASGEERRSGPGAFLGSVGSIWNSAVNTFRGVAGAHARRSSWPARRSTRGARQPQRSSRPGVSPSSVNVATGAYPAAAVITSPGVSPRELVSPMPAHYRQISGGVASPLGSDGGSRRASGGDASGSSSASGSRGVGSGSGSGSGKNVLFSPPSGQVALYGKRYQLDGINYGNDDTVGGVSGSGSGSGSGLPLPIAEEADVVRHGLYTPCPDTGSCTSCQHRRYHSDPVATQRSSQPATAKGDAAAASGGTGGPAWNAGETAETERVKAAADRATVVGKRSILIVTLADKTAQGAMSLALESPRDSRSATGSARTTREAAAAADARSRPDPSSARAASSHPSLSSRKRHAMLTEALSLYVKALAILQGALPAVLVECEGVSTQALAAWNPLSGGADHPAGRPAEDRHPERRSHSRQTRQPVAPRSCGRSSPPSPALLARRSELVKKASWLRELFSQTLQRAEHCRAQITAAGDAGLTVAGSGDGDAGGGNVASPTSASPWSSLGAGVTPPSDAAAAAVFRAAMEHGQEAAVCYLLGRSESASAHYVRACALLQLLALEPEMSGGSSGAGAGSGDREHRVLRRGVSVDACVGRGSGAMEGDVEQVRSRKQLGGWQAQLLVMADGYARRVELISRGDVAAAGSREHAVQRQTVGDGQVNAKAGEGGGEVVAEEGAAAVEEAGPAAGASLPPEFMYTS